MLVAFIIEYLSLMTQIEFNLNVLGSDEERGLIQWKQLSKNVKRTDSDYSAKLNTMYGFPLIGKQNVSCQQLWQTQIIANKNHLQVPWRL